MLQSANGYMHAAVRFDFPALFMLAGLLVYGNAHNKDLPGLATVSEKIIKAAIGQLDKWLQQISRGHKKSLICSQLVYQIYNECGEKYRIQLDNSFAVCESMNKNRKNVDLKYDEDSMEISDILVQEALEKTEELAEELLKCLNEAQKGPSEPILNTPIHNIIFHKRLVDLTDRLEISVTPESLFIMPNDLLHHTLNLQKIGTCDIVTKA